jgi:uncharacterized protein with FMN-binding domain
MSMKRSDQGSGFAQKVQKFFLSAFVIVSFVAYLIHDRHISLNSTTAGNTNTINNGNHVLAAQSAAGSYKDGIFTGPTVDVIYGLVQVQVVIQNGKISNVKFLQYPNDRRTSVAINTQVMPWLTQEALQAQNANVSLITGATLTSEGFVNSLQAALLSAKN